MNSITFWMSVPHRCLSPNYHGHWRNRSKQVKLARETAYLIARAECDKAGGPPRWEKASVSLNFYFCHKRRRDEDNLIASMKPIYDGIADAGVLVNDSGLTTERPLGMNIDNLHPRVEITVTRIS